MIIAFVESTVIVTVCDGGGYCSFPPFLWQPHDDGTPRRWISRTEYFDASDTWEKQKHITAQETEITMQHKVGLFYNYTHHKDCKIISNQIVDVSF